MLGLIIAGFDHIKEKDYGETYPTKCPNCNNNVYLHLKNIKKFFTVFFIPLIPYKSKYYLLCPICNTGTKLSKEEVEKAKEFMKA